MSLFWFGVVWSKHNRALGKTSVVAEGRTGSVPKHTRGCHRKRALVVLRLPCSLAKRVLVAFRLRNLGMTGASRPFVLATLYLCRNKLSEQTPRAQSICLVFFSLCHTFSPYGAQYDLFRCRVSIYRYRRQITHRPAHLLIAPGTFVHTR